MRRFFTNLLILMLISVSAFAYDLNGKMSDNGDGTYSVLLENSYGHVFTGVAVDEGNGSFDIAVEDLDGESFAGYALDNDNGGYMLNLENDATGDLATGTLEKQ